MKLRTLIYMNVFFVIIRKYLYSLITLRGNKTVNSEAFGEEQMCAGNNNVTYLLCIEE